MVVGFLHIEKKIAEEVRALAAEPQVRLSMLGPLCASPAFLKKTSRGWRCAGETLRISKQGSGAAAGSPRLFPRRSFVTTWHDGPAERSNTICCRAKAKSFTCNFGTGLRLLKQRGAIHIAAAGKNAGCWVMKLAESEGELPAKAPPPSGRGSRRHQNHRALERHRHLCGQGHRLPALEIWLAGKGFLLRAFPPYPGGHTVWVSTDGRERNGSPTFGNAAKVYNVIDSRQTYLQNMVFAGCARWDSRIRRIAPAFFLRDGGALAALRRRDGLRATRRRGQEALRGGQRTQGLGVKADDLLDRLEANAREVDTRHPEAPEAERVAIAHAIAIGALRYFLLKFTRGTVIAFDFREALNFDGETGPYVQYAVVRARNIFRKLREQEPEFKLDALESLITDEALSSQLSAPAGNDLWEVLLLAGSLGAQVETALGAHEPAFIAKFAFQLAQQFNVFYHKHHILSEEDVTKKAFLLSLSRLVETQLVIALRLLGMEAPERM